MAVEIERKFLVRGDYKPFITASFRIIQGYLSSVPERTVRVRIKGDQAFLTVKGRGSRSGMSRFEWETKISVKDAQNLLDLCEPGKIDKTRHLVQSAGQRFEVDEFHGDNQGLVLAELEISSEEEKIQIPDWLGKEVTGQKKYYNAMLKDNPFKNWPK